MNAQPTWTKDTPERRELILHFLREGYSFTVAAAKAGISRDTLYVWRKADKAFAEDCDAAAGQGIGDIECAVVEMAKAKDLNAAKFILERRKGVRDEYQPAQHNGPMVAIQQVFNPLGQLAPFSQPVLTQAQPLPTLEHDPSND